MRKKMFCRAARVVKEGRWKIDFTITDATTGHDSRKRMDFGLNAIEDPAVRAATAEAICGFLRSFDFSFDFIEKKHGPSLAEAIGPVLLRKTQSARRNTNDSYASIIRVFMKWANSERLATEPFSSFQKNEVRAFLLFLKKKELGPRTLNNYRAVLRMVWAEVADGDTTVPNPWKQVKALPVGEKNRRMFTEAERIAVASHVAATDYWLFRGLLLQYYCFIRPCELSRLKFKNFDLARGLVKINWYEAKMKREGWCTIPQSAMHYFRDGIFDKQPGNFYLFGVRGTGARRGADTMGPAATPARDDRAYKRHVAVLAKLKKQGVLTDTNGLTWYSWKDTGVSTHIHSTSPLATRDQARHREMETTLIYYHEEKVNSDYAALPDTLLGEAPTVGSSPH